jgi:hypothetical protein
MSGFDFALESLGGDGGKEDDREREEDVLMIGSA